MSTVMEGISPSTRGCRGACRLAERFGHTPLLPATPAPGPPSPGRATRPSAARARALLGGPPGPLLRREGSWETCILTACLWSSVAMVTTHRPRSNREIGINFPLHPKKYTLFSCEGLSYEESRDFTIYYLPNCQGGNKGFTPPGRLESACGGLGFSPGAAGTRAAPPQHPQPPAPLPPRLPPRAAPRCFRNSLLPPPGLFYLLRPVCGTAGLRQFGVSLLSNSSRQTEKLPAKRSRESKRYKIRAIYPRV